MRVAPWHQTNWDWRAAANFIGGGSGTGLLFFATLASGSVEAFRFQALLALALIGLGLTCVWAEIGRPWRALNVFLHPQTSWMTREGMVAPFVFLCGLVGIWQGGGVAADAAALFGLAFLYCQARILAAAKGIPAWREPRIIPLIVATGFTEGAGLAAFLSVFLPGDAPRWLAGVLLGALILRRLAWTMYSDALAKKGAPKKALEVLRPFGAKFEMTGQLAPEMLVVLAIFSGGSAFPFFVALAGLLAAVAGWWLKFTIVARAAYNQGFALPMLPVRGQGEPTQGVKPGWTK